MKDLTTILSAVAMALVLALPAWADESKTDGDGEFFEDLGDDAGNFFDDIGDFFSEDVPEAVEEETSKPRPKAKAKAKPTAKNNPYASKPKLLSDQGSIRRAQTLLAGKGFDPGPADGVMGRKTRAAIVSYQRRNGIRVTGQVTDHLLMHLKGVRPPKSSTVAKVRPKKTPQRGQHQNRTPDR